MLSVHEAIDCIADSVKAVGTEPIPLAAGLNRILASDVVASIDLPPFSHSIVDGFAIRHQDVEQRRGRKISKVRVIESISAGSMARETVKPGTAIRVMTGVPIPKGADAVVKQEDVYWAGHGAAFIQVEKPVALMENVASTGEDVRRGEIVLEKGTSLAPGEIGILASLGLQEVTVFREPNIALLSTGNELVGLGEPLGEGKIFASSFYVVLAKLRESGCTIHPLGVVGDSVAHIVKRIRDSLGADGIITTGGTQRGDSDWVKDVYRQMGIHMKIDGVAMSPGKSFVFGVFRGKPIFNLPGSPTACLIAFEELVRPALMRMGGKRGYQNLSRPTIKMRLGQNIRGKRGLRKYVLSRIVLRDGRLMAIPISRKHRGTITPMVQANGIIILPEDGSDGRRGEEVDVRLLNMNL